MGTKSILKPLIICLFVFSAFGASAQNLLKVLSYNIHAGHGNAEVNLQQFKALLEGDEHLVCLQEVKPSIWSTVQASFAEFPYVQVVWRQTTDALGPLESPQQEASVIFSKLSFLTKSERLIQVDPGGDLWERKAGFVSVSTSNSQDDAVLIGCYHNTYNFNNNDFESEQAGMRKFRDISLQEMSATTLDTDKPYVLAGDFNVFEDKITKVLPDVPFTYSVGRDHIATNVPLVDAYTINTSTLNISDHDVVAVTLDIVVTEDKEVMPRDSIDEVPTTSGGVIGLGSLIALAGLLSMIIKPPTTFSNKRS